MSSEKIQPASPVALTPWESLLDHLESCVENEEDIYLDSLYSLVATLEKESCCCAKSIRFSEDGEIGYFVVEWENARFFFDARIPISEGSFSAKKTQRVDNVHFQKLPTLAKNFGVK